MNRILTLMLVVSGAACFLIGCGDTATAPSSQSPGAKAVAPDPSLVLEEEPADALSVGQARSTAKDGDELVVAGWIAGSAKPIIEGRAAFTIVDMNIPPRECSEVPYSLCCMPKETLLPKMVLVKFVDQEGKTILKDAHGLLGITEGASVVVRGKAKCSEEGQLTAILADGLFIRGDSYMAAYSSDLSKEADESVPADDTQLSLPE